MKLYVFQIDGKVRVYGIILRFYTIVIVNGTWCVGRDIRHRRPFKDDASKASEVIDWSRRGWDASTHNGFKANAGGRATASKKKERSDVASKRCAGVSQI